MAEREELLRLAANIVSAHASNNALPADQLPELIQQVFSALATAGSAIECWPSSADGFWPTPGPSTYGRPSRSGGLAWTGEPKWICSSSFVGSMNLVLER